MFAQPAYAASADCPTGWETLKSDDRVCCPPGTGSGTAKCLYGKYINPTVKVLSAVAGLAVIIGMSIGGIQYASSAGDPQKAAAGKAKVVKAIYGLLAFLFLFSALQFLSPGGIGSNSKPSGGGGSIASQCSKPFLGIKPWFAYLPDEAFDSGTCNIDNFSLFGNDTTGSQVMPVLVAIADGLVRVAGLIAVGFVITGGVQYIISQGEPDRTKRAKDTIINALIGLVIAIIAASVTSFIGGRLS